MEEAGTVRFESPMLLPRALRTLAHEAVVTDKGPHPLADLEPSPPSGSVVILAAVPPTCHKQRSRAVTSGQSPTLADQVVR
jgi:hypothetical protein